MPFTAGLEGRLTNVVAMFWARTRLPATALAAPVLTDGTTAMVSASMLPT